MGWRDFQEQTPMVFMVNMVLMPPTPEQTPLKPLKPLKPHGGLSGKQVGDPDWKPTPAAWLEGDQLHITGVVADLEGTIRFLTEDQAELRGKLLSTHIKSYMEKEIKQS